MYKVFDFSFDTDSYPTVEDVKTSLLSQIQAIQNDSDLPVSTVEIAVPSNKEGRTRGFGYLYFDNYKLSELVMIRSESKSTKSSPSTPVTQRKMTSSWADEVDDETITSFSLRGFTISQHELNVDSTLDTHVVMTRGDKRIIDELYPEILRRLRLFSTVNKFPVTLPNREDQTVTKKFLFDKSNLDGYYAMLFMRVSYYQTKNGPHTLVFIHPKRRD